jgi:hypothetical protein
MNLTLPRFFWSEYRKRRKKVSLITFALFWGTLSILLLMAFGQGLTTQFRVAFSGLGETLIMVYGGQTSLEFEGLPKGRPISLYPEDVDYLRERIPEIMTIAPGVQLPAGLGQREGGQPQRSRHDGRIRPAADPDRPAGRPLSQRRRRRRGEKSRLYRLEGRHGPVRRRGRGGEAGHHQPHSLYRHRRVEEKDPGFDVPGARRGPDLSSVLRLSPDR